MDDRLAAVMVVPWMIGAWLLYRAIGSIWPLIVGHTLYDAALLTTMRTSQAWVSSHPCCGPSH